MKHLSMIQKYQGNLDELVQDIGNLRYDTLAEVLAKLASKLKEDAFRDNERARKKLASALQCSANHVLAASKEMEKAWDICKPYM